MRLGQSVESWADEKGAEKNEDAMSRLQAIRWDVPTEFRPNFRHNLRDNSMTRIPKTGYTTAGEQLRFPFVMDAENVRYEEENYPSLRTHSHILGTSSNESFPWSRFFVTKVSRVASCVPASLFKCMEKPSSRRRQPSTDRISENDGHRTTAGSSIPAVNPPSPSSLAGWVLHRGTSRPTAPKALFVGFKTRRERHTT